MKQFLLTILISIICSVLIPNISANDSLKIVIVSPELSGSAISLGYYYMDRSFQKSKILLGKNGIGFSNVVGHEGLYFLILPDNSIYDFFVTNGNLYNFQIRKNNSHFIISQTSNSVCDTFSIYRQILLKLNHTKDSILSLSSINKDDSNSNRLNNIEKLKLELLYTYFRKLNGSLPGNYLKVFLPNPTINPTLIKLEKTNDSLNWMNEVMNYQNHFFDNINWYDNRLLYTPVVAEKFFVYLNNMIKKSSSSQITAINNLLDIPKDSTFQVTLSEFLLHKYYQQRFDPEMEMVYLYVAKKNITLWESINPEKARKLNASIGEIEPLTIGKQAPEFELPGENFRVYNLARSTAEFKVILFWDDACGSCKKVIQELIKVYNVYDYLQVLVYTIYTGSDIEKWNGFVTNNLPKEWMNTYETAKYKVSDIYHVAQTPSFYLLNNDLQILDKNFTIKELEMKFFNNATNQK